MYSFSNFPLCGDKGMKYFALWGIKDGDIKEGVGNSSRVALYCCSFILHDFGACLGRLLYYIRLRAC